MINGAMRRKILAYFLVPFFAVFGPFYQALSILKIHCSNEEAIVEIAGLLLVANYAALFAIRKPGVEPGYDLSFMPLQNIIEKHFAPVAS